MQIDINKRSYWVKPNEFNTIIHNEYNNLIIREGLGEMERVCYLLKELVFTGIDTLICYNPTHGGFIPINILLAYSETRTIDAVAFDGITTGKGAYKHIYALNILSEHKSNIERNIQQFKINNIQYEIKNDLGGCVVFSESWEYIDMDFVMKYRPIVISQTSAKNGVYKTILNISNTSYSVYIPDKYSDIFYAKFNYSIKTRNDGEEILQCDNLINMCIMVKNGGEHFSKMLEENMKYIDRWTILDTGSTDNTVETIKRVLVGKIPGELYEEPFINFRDSRNRLLELAGTTCKYTIMLDDTYVIQGDLRGFLNEVRGDQFSDSFSFYIHSRDVEYSSNRILISDRKLKYIHTIHEVINPNNNNTVIIPQNRVYIVDNVYEYMETRTMDRKKYDLQMLYKELEEDPNDPRALYYLAQTYHLVEDYENTFKYYMERANHPVEGYLHEKIDAIFEAARCANFNLNKPWKECEELYNRAYALDKTRPDCIYFIGIHYFLEGDKKTAYDYFKLAFEIGYPAHAQYSLKPTLSYHFIPKFLTPLCYEYDNYELGEKCAKLYLSKNDNTADQYAVIESYYNMFVKLNMMNNELTIDILNDKKPLVCFVADGGFEPWTGSDILSKGIGGSETYIIEMARHMQKNGRYKVVVFCNCLTQSIFEDVEYIPIDQFMPFAKSRDIHACIISRYSEYVPVAISGKVESIYMVLHDLLPSGIVLPIHNKVKKILCLTEWHVDYVSNIFPQYVDKIIPLYYGIDIDLFDGCKKINTFSYNDKLSHDNMKNTDDNIQMYILEYTPKVPLKFIYSSYPNRGLYQLLQMWPEIVRVYPTANLHIYSDVNGKWVNNVEPIMMQNIRELYDIYERRPNGLNIYKYGWVDKKTLAEAWKTAEYWFYPCTFMETFCLTALEAAISRTAVITNGLATLQNTVGDRGICIPGDATDMAWQQMALFELFDIIENTDHRNKLIEKNYQWAKNLSWKSQACILEGHISSNQLASQILFEDMSSFDLRNSGSHASSSFPELFAISGSATNTNIPSYDASTHSMAIDNTLVYADMYNWTNDLPIGTNAKIRFEKAIDRYIENNNKPIHSVLEIGTYAGTSIIEIVRKIPNSVGLAIDRWTNYDDNNNNIMLQNIEQSNVEGIFHDNVRIAGLEHRIESIKGKSSEILVKLIRDNMTYDFIYVDGSHKTFDVIVDLFLAWQLLNKKGVMAIDDYLFHYDKCEELPYEYPYEAVNHFLKDIDGQYKLIDKAYRVFIEKC